jgi:hypothetical protein
MLEEHFQSLHEVVNKVNKIAKDKYNEMKDKQNGAIKQMELATATFQENLTDMQITLESLMKASDPELACMTMKAGELLGAINKLQIPIKCKDKSIIKVQLNNKMYDKAEDYLSKHTEIAISELTDRTEATNRWACINCETFSVEATCPKCYSYRPLHNYKTLETMPPSNDELKELQRRREEEKALIVSRDSTIKAGVPTDNLYYLISAQWLFHWKSFIFNNAHNGNPYPCSKDVGIYPPGPISNWQLVEDSVPKMGLRSVQA